MVPTDTISHIAGHRHLQLLKHLCSLFVFVSLCLGTVVLTLGSSVNFHIHRITSHHHHKARDNLRLVGEQLGEEMDRDPKRAGHGAY